MKREDFLKDIENQMKASILANKLESESEEIKTNHVAFDQAIEFFKNIPSDLSIPRAKVLTEYDSACNFMWENVQDKYNIFLNFTDGNCTYYVSKNPENVKTVNSLSFEKTNYSEIYDKLKIYFMVME